MRHIPVLVAAITIPAFAAEKPSLPRLHLSGDEQSQGIIAQDTGKLMPFGQTLFASGQGGYHTYRIPALAVTPRGTVLAFCEGRKQSGSDTGDIDLLFKRSTEHGTTWSEQQVIWHDAGNACGNLCAVVDRDTGIQIEHGPHKGRLVIPFDHIEADTRHLCWMRSRRATASSRSALRSQ